MSTFCTIYLGLKLFSVDGLCEEKPAEEIYMPPEDKTVWEYIEPEVEEIPVPKKEEIPTFPPVIITKVIEKEVVKEPAQKAPPKKIVKKAKPEPKPDPVRQWLENGGANMRRTVSVQAASLNRLQGVSTAQTSNQKIPKMASRLRSNQSTPVEKTPAPKLKDEEYDYTKRLSSLPVDNTRILTADRFISGVIETGINSQIASGDGGEIIIQTSRDVFGYHGRSILVPKGSRMICSYEGADDVGSTRLAIICKRILMGGHRAEIVQLEAPIGNAQGQAGVTGDVNNRFAEKYGTAFVLAGISGAVRMASALAVDGSGETTTAESIIEAGSTDLSQKLGEISATILEETVNLKPTITIPQGTRVQIRAKADWYIQKIEEGS